VSYTDLLQEDAVSSNYLAIMNPRAIVSGFTLFSGSVYSAPFSMGYVSAVTDNNKVLAAGTSTSLSAGQYFHDADNGVLYIRRHNSLTPSGRYIVAAFEIYLSTRDANWYRIPTDTTSRAAVYDGLIQASPAIRASVADAVFGFIPVGSVNLAVLNNEHKMEEFLSSVSYNLSPCVIYHWLGEDLETANIRKVFDGIVTNHTYDNEKVSFSLRDSIDFFNKEWRLDRNSTFDDFDRFFNFFHTSTFADIDETYQGKPVRYIIGVVEGFKPILYNPINDTPSSSQNRTWILKNTEDASYSPALNIAVSGAPPNTTTRTYLTSTSGLQVGDSVDFSNAASKSAFITAVTGTYIDHTSNVVAQPNSGTVARGSVAFVDIFQQGVRYRAKYGDQYTEGYSAPNTTIQFTTTLETDLGMPKILSPQDTVSCKAYGQKPRWDIEGSPFNQNLVDGGGSLGAGVGVLYEIIRQAGVPESEINTDSFQDAVFYNGSVVGFSIPQKSTDKFPTYKQIISDLCQTLMLRIYRDNDNKWAVSRLKPLADQSTDFTLSDDEILKGAPTYSMDYGDTVSDVIVQYGFREVPPNNINNPDSYKSVQWLSENALYLHQADKQKTFKSLHTRSDEALTLAKRLSYMFGDRQGRLTIRTNLLTFQALIDDVVTINRSRLPGFAFDYDTVQTRDFAIVETSRTRSDVTLILDDQKGIEDNEPLWGPY
jgi:hypothetical protein